MIKCEAGEIAISTSEKAKPKSINTHLIICGKKEGLFLIWKLRVGDKKDRKGERPEQLWLL